jgi:hypothetical protein
MMTLSSSNISHDGAIGDGGGIYSSNSSMATISGCIVEFDAENYSVGSGGGINNLGTMTVSGSYVEYNAPDDTPAIGGGAGYGAGIANSGNLIVSSCWVAWNTAIWEGGGIYNSNNGTLNVSSSYLFYDCVDYAAGNGGGIDNLGKLTVSHTYVEYDFAVNGGGIASSSTLNATSIGVYSNDATSGGGIYNKGSMTITDSTVESNTALYSAGIYSTQTVSNSTIAGNVQAGPSLAAFQVATDNSVYALDSTKGLWRSTPTSGFAQIGWNVAAFEVAPDNSVYALNSSDSSFWRYTPTSGFVRIGFGIASFQGAPDGSLYALTNVNGLWHYTPTYGFAQIGWGVNSLQVAPDNSVYSHDATNPNALWYYSSGKWTEFALSSLSQTQWTEQQPGYVGSIAVSGGLVNASNLTITGLPTGLSDARRQHNQYQRYSNPARHLYRHSVVVSDGELPLGQAQCDLRADYQSAAELGQPECLAGDRQLEVFGYDIFEWWIRRLRQPNLHWFAARPDGDAIGKYGHAQRHANPDRHVQRGAGGSGWGRRPGQPDLCHYDQSASDPRRPERPTMHRKPGLQRLDPGQRRHRRLRQPVRCWPASGVKRPA